MKKTVQRWMAVLLCAVMLCAVGCTPSDDTTVTTTTTTQETVTTTTTESSVVADDTTTTVEDVTTIDDVTSTTEDKVAATTTIVTVTTSTAATTTTTKNNVTTTKNKVTTTKNKMTTTTSSVTTTKKNVTTTTQEVTTAATTTAPTTTTTTKYNGPVRVITCYGDSVTEGMGVNQEFKYPTQLQKLLGDGYQVQNAGDGGEKTHSIMARQGALKIYLKNDVTFAAGETQVLIDEGNGRGVVSKDGVEMQWTPPYGRDLPMNKVTINGQAYEFKFTDHNYEQNGTCKTYLTREAGGQAVTLAKGTEVTINVATTSKSNYCDIYLMGFNGTYADVDDLIAQHKQMIAYRGNDNYLIIIPFFDKRSLTEIQAFKDAFGDHALDFFAYSKDTKNFEKVGFTVTNQDRMNIQQNTMPYRFKLYGATQQYDVHLSADGYTLLAQALYEQGQKVNLW